MNGSTSRTDALYPYDYTVNAESNDFHLSATATTTTTTVGDLSFYRHEIFELGPTSFMLRSEDL